MDRGQESHQTIKVDQEKVQREIIEGDWRKRGEGSRKQGGFTGSAAASGGPLTTETDRATGELGELNDCVMFRADRRSLTPATILDG